MVADLVHDGLVSRVVVPLSESLCEAGSETHALLHRTDSRVVSGDDLVDVVGRDVGYAKSLGPVVR